MAKIKKKGQAGQAKNYITRTQAVRKLQISLPDFRRLCIFKGIYPRQPRNRQKAAKNSTPSTTFYYTKDIQYLLHEPLLNKFRDHNALAKKIARALGKGQAKDAARLEKTHAPRMTLDHIVKERYPTFNDALRDLDDALSMLFLFANLPSHMNIPPKTIRLCQRLCHEFQHYLIITHSLRKSFLSIKGIYYQATIQGQDILWLVPYNFVQRVTGDIDFRIMGTFVEFYTTLLGFVNYRLYTTAGLVYPPKFSSISDEQGGALAAFIPQARRLNADVADGKGDQRAQTRVNKQATQRAQAIADNLAQGTNAETDGNDVDGQDSEGEDQPPVQTNGDAQQDFQRQTDNADEAEQAAISSSEMSRMASELFKPYVFYLSRETPRTPLEFLLKAFGCNKIGWDEVLGAGAFTHDERDQRITHQIVDRPPVAAVSTSADGESAPTSAPVRGRIPGRTYVQPQWIWDCANACELLRPDLYAPGATLPPHLSPFVKPKAGEYDPSKPLEPGSEDEDVGEDVTPKEMGEQDLEQDEEEEISSMDSDTDEVGKDQDVIEGVDSVKELADLNGTATDGLVGGDGDDFEGFDESGGESDDYEQNLKAETTGAPVTTVRDKAQQTKDIARRKKRKQREDEAWNKDRQKMMMSRKKRTLYEKMEYSNNQKDTANEKLRAKRRKIERSKG